MMGRWGRLVQRVLRDDYEHGDGLTLSLGLYYPCAKMPKWAGDINSKQIGRRGHRERDLERWCVAWIVDMGGRDRRICA